MAYYNGIEMAKHQIITQKLISKFTSNIPNLPEKDTLMKILTESLRKDFPKGTDFNLIDEIQLLKFEHKLNNKSCKL